MLGPNSNQVNNKLQAIGASTNQRFFTKTRVNETMVRELISWLGLLSANKHGIKLLLKFKIFEHTEQLIDSNGYYDHVS